MALTPFTIFGQSTTITGKVTDALTNEAVPFATVIFKGSNIGTNTDFEGNFRLNSATPTDSILCTLVGYKPVLMRVKKGETQIINIVLSTNQFEFQEVVIRPGENPALQIIRNIIEHKPDNDPSKLSSYQFEVYNKLEFDITNINDKLKNNKLLKPFNFIWDNIDSSETNSKPFLPFFISESLSDIYFKSNPKDKREIIKASKISGLENATVTQFLGDMYQKVDIYGNFIDLFGKSFVSPTSNIGTLYYKYYLLDSTFINNKWCYKIKFRPRRPEDLTFLGELWVNDTTWAIKKIDMRISAKANINWVEDMAIVQEYTYFNNQQWMLSKDKLVVDFAAKDDGTGFIGRKTTSYRDFHINEQPIDSIFKGAENIIVKVDAADKSAEFWDNSRHDSLSNRELQIYHMVDTIKSLPAFQTYVNLITMFFTGYKDIGKIELGPYYTFYSFNKIEGNRFRIGARTSDDFSTKIQLDGYVAYGLKDERFKYGGGIRYKLSDKPRQFIGVNYKNDVQQLGQSDNAFQDDNVLSSLFRRNPANRLNNIEYHKAWYEIEWVPGISNRITYQHTKFTPLGDLKINYYYNDDTTDIRNSYKSTELNLYFRFAYREKFVAGKVDRVSLGSDYPILQVNYTQGIKGLESGFFNYQKINAKVDDLLRLAPFGYAYWAITAGRIWGKVPYPLLEMHPGNETYFYDYAAFNLMNYFEFVSDYYLTGTAVQHFDGFFFNKIPLMRKLQWREIAQVKAVWGGINKRNLDILENKSAFTTLRSKPYVEVGAGVENIFKILRVDFLWRLAYLENQNISKYGIRASLQLTF
ncbi:MAG: hypothetical protein RL516_960 [Bacteroidota bacterium]